MATMVDKWLLVHDGAKVICRCFHTGEVATLRTIETFDSEDEMETRIDDLGLIDECGCD